MQAYTHLSRKVYDERRQFTKRSTELHILSLRTNSSLIDKKTNQVNARSRGGDLTTSREV